jgi:hypothetical protein
MAMRYRRRGVVSRRTVLTLATACSMTAGTAAAQEPGWPLSEGVRIETFATPPIEYLWWARGPTVIWDGAVLSMWRYNYDSRAKRTFCGLAPPNCRGRRHAQGDYPTRWDHCFPGAIRPAQLCECAEREPSTGQKARDAYRVLELTKQICDAGRSTLIPESTIDDLVLMLPDILTILPASLSLEELGPRARRAIPAIEAALREHERLLLAQPIAPPTSSLQRIRTALARLRRS